jgi:hypothetical protein
VQDRSLPVHAALRSTKDIDMMFCVCHIPDLILRKTTTETLRQETARTTPHRHLTCYVPCRNDQTHVLVLFRPCKHELSRTMQNDALSVVRLDVSRDAWSSHHLCETHWPGPLRIAGDEHNHSLFASHAPSDASSSDQDYRVHADFHISSMWLQPQ